MHENKNRDFFAFPKILSGNKQNPELISAISAYLKRTRKKNKKN